MIAAIFFFNIDSNYLFSGIYDITLGLCIMADLYCFKTLLTSIDEIRMCQKASLLL